MLDHGYTIAGDPGDHDPLVLRGLVGDRQNYTSAYIIHPNKSTDILTKLLGKSLLGPGELVYIFYGTSGMELNQSYFVNGESKDRTRWLFG